MKRCCAYCFWQQKLKSYEPDVAGRDLTLHSRCERDKTIHRTNKEQRGCKYFRAKEELR